ncbi:MAG: leucine-rich repeat domain-containing protein [bacterium]|nr:leucine-rich repeat domain-containing protein [bacterium]
MAKPEIIEELEKQLGINLKDKYMMADADPECVMALDLGSCKLTDISSLVGLKSLTTLNLANNQLTGISSLAGLTSLTQL